MATINVLAVNMTSADVVQDTYTAKAGVVTSLAIDTTAHATAPADLLTAGVLLVRSDFSDTLDTPTQYVEKASHLLEGMARAIASAGSDTHGQAGL